MVAEGKDEGEGIGRQFGMEMYTLLYSKRITNKDLLFSTWNSYCSAPAWMGEGLGENEYVYMLSHFQLCLTLCNPIDGSPPGSPVPGILQARTLEWLPFPSPVHESEK